MKLHLGVIAVDKSNEPQIKEALEHIGGGYIHYGKSMLELVQKLSLQKIQMLVYFAPEGETGAEAQSVVNFFRGKKDYANLPICIIVNSAVVEMKYLLKDSWTRGFPKSGGVFLALMTMQPLLAATVNKAEIQTASVDWIKEEFLESLRGKVGNVSQFEVGVAADDDVRTQFYGHHVDELRSHLGWFKYSARIIEKDDITIDRIFPNMTKEEQESVADNLMKAVVRDFKNKVYEDLRLRGAIFYPPIEELPPADRKIVYSGSKSHAIIFKAKECCVVLEVIQYI